MNIVHYMWVFDQGSDAIGVKLGIDEKSIERGEPTLVASRILIKHRAELMEREEWELWTGLAAATEDYLTFVHRLTVGGVTRATCDLRAAAFDVSLRKAAKLAPGQVEQARNLLVPGIQDVFSMP